MAFIMRSNLGVIGLFVLLAGALSLVGDIGIAADRKVRQWMRKH